MMILFRKSFNVSREGWKLDPGNDGIGSMMTHCRGLRDRWGWERRGVTGSGWEAEAAVQLSFGAWQHSVNSQLLLRIKELKNSWADGRQRLIDPYFV